jgi:hypothetical protein
MTEMRDIPGFEGRYLATRDGQIWSVKRRKFRAQSLQSTGYFTITLRCPVTKKTLTKAVHRLVAATWISNPTGLPQINHKDGNKQNNAIENLEWCTGSENMKHAWKNGLQPLTERMIASARNACAISARANRKMSVDMVSEAVRRVRAGEMQKTVASDFGVSRALMSKIIKDAETINGATAA